MVNDGIYLSGRYQVLSKIGTGGMADVYKGKDVMLNRYVAIKVLKKEDREDKSFVRKFRSEAQAAAGLLNQNIVNVYDVGEDRGLYYMVMELVEGITLKDYIQKKGRLRNKEVISIAIQFCSGIEAAHSHDIIHRDIKPQNIMISRDGKVKVTDFGIARATSAGRTETSNALGSVHYVSPEQARGLACDVRTDIYSVGITIYEMITGRLPYDGDSTVSVAMKHLQENMIPPSAYVPDMSSALEKIILKCTQKTPERRYQTIGELIQDLKRALVDPEGNFVKIPPIRSIGDTVIISPEEVARLKNRPVKHEKYRVEKVEEEEDEDDYDDRSYEDDGVSSRMDGMMKVLTAIVALIILLIILLIGGNALGIFRFGPSKGEDPGPVEEIEEGDIEVPKLIGEKEAVAEEMCKKRNLEMVVVKKESSDEYDEGVVIGQSLEAGTMVTKKTIIEVTVSSGAEEVEILDVSDMSEDEAWAKLKGQGFTKHTATTEYSDEVDEGNVIRTNPAAGETVTVDTEIELVVSKGPEKVEVPKLVGQTLSEARKLIKESELVDGGYTEEFSNSVAEGVVISQSITAGKKVDAGKTITYVVSKGVKPLDQVNVPTLCGHTLSSAIKALNARDLKYKEVSAQSPSPSGTVVDVSPAEGTRVDVGTVITLYVSDGSGAVPDDPEPTPEPTPETPLQPTE